MVTQDFSEAGKTQTSKLKQNMRDFGKKKAEGEKERSDPGMNKLFYFTASSGSFTLSSRSQADKGTSSSDPPCRVGLKNPFYTANQNEPRSFTYCSH